MCNFMAKFIYKDGREQTLHIKENDPYLGGRIHLSGDQTKVYLDRVAFKFDSSELKQLGNFSYLTFYEI